MTMTAAAGGEVLIKNVIPKHLEAITDKLLQTGCEIEEYDDSILVRRNAKLNKTNVKTLPHPGFPTDMQPQMTTLLAIAQGTSIVTEGVWDNRFKYVDELRRMGAKIRWTARWPSWRASSSFPGRRSRQWTCGPAWRWCRLR